MEKSFDLSVCRLLQKHPLYDHRTWEGSEYFLRVLLIGSGQKLNALRDKILSHGQLLNTRLDVTVVTGDKKAALEELAAAAPDLKRFVDINGERTAEEMPCGTLSYEEAAVSEGNIRELLEKHGKDRKYVLISLDAAAAAPGDIEPAPGQVIVWVTGDTIRVCGTDQSFSPDRAGSDMADLEQIAYRLHYAYEKGNDPYITNREIRKSFGDLYNYQSNIECALHIQSKIKCADIDPTVLNSAAEKFAEKMAEDMRNGGNLLERLAQLEHRRWCISKATACRRLPDDLNVIYGDDGSTTHSKGNEKVKWHVALVPYVLDDRYRSHLSEQDWLRDDPNAIPDLDELDRQTLRVHRQCAKISGDKLKCAQKHLEQIALQLPKDMEKYGVWLEKALDRMMKSEREAVFAFRHHRRDLQAQLSEREAGAMSALKEGLRNETYEKLQAALKDLKESQEPDAAYVADHLKTLLAAQEAAELEAHLHTVEWTVHIQKSLDQLDRDMGAPMEYLTRKDYKKQNLTQIGSIPFALCGWKSTVLVKLMAESIHECVSAAWQLEPGKIVFVDTAETLEELKLLKQKARRIETFLSRNCNQVLPSYHIFIPQDAVCIPGSSGQEPSEQIYLKDILLYDPTLFGSSWQLHPCRDLTPDELRPCFVDLMYDCGATSIDMTGGKPILISLADGYSRNNRIGAFFIQNGRIHNFCGARGMEYQSLDKGLSVQQLFDQTDIVLSKREDQGISREFYEKYEALWKIAHGNAEAWHAFCTCYDNARRKKPGSTHPDESLRIPKDIFEQGFGKEYWVDGEKRVLRTEFKKILGELLDEKMLTYDSNEGVYQAFCPEMVKCMENSGKILEYYICCSIQGHDRFTNEAMSWTFRHSDRTGAPKNEIDVICIGKTTLFISAKNVSKKSLEKSEKRNYIYYEISWLSDRFGGPRCRPILAAPNLAQFENGQRNKIVKQAMERGVYLLGDACFEDGKLIDVLTNIDEGEEKWCELLQTASV